MKRASAIVVLMVLGFCAAMAQNPAPKKTQTQKLAKLAEPWPDADTLHKRRVDAEQRPLFQSKDPLVFTIEADFNAVNKDRDPNSTKTYPATATFTGTDGHPQAVALNLAPRGHVRRMAVTCSFVPLRLEFTKAASKGTVLEGNATSLKLITHCQNTKENDQYVLREYLTYQLSNLMTPQSFRGRLAKVTYVDSKTHKPITTRYGMLLEDDGDVARRMEGRTVALQRTVFTDLDTPTLDRLMLFEFMIGNTDVSIYGLHNIVLVQMPDKSLHPVAYDWDQSGLVHTSYSLPAPDLGIKSVTERLYRGPCRSADALEPTFAAFRAKKNDMMAIIGSQPDLSAESASEMRGYLNDFFSIMDRSSSVKKYFIDGCKRTTM